MSAAPSNSDRSFLQTLDRHTRLFIAWMLFVVFCQCAGWGLSALGALNALGYGVVLLLFVIIAYRIVKTPSGNGAHSARRFPFRARFKRPFPVAFLILAGLALLGGALYPPNNFDALAYRTPRVLHWLAENRWHWIHADFGNLNTRGAGFEWVTAPLVALTKTDRLIFLINAVCFLFLPGRVFALLTRLGIRPRVAYYWMWIYPTGYGFLLQAGGIGNDLFAAIWPLAALEFALRARETKRVEFVWMSGLAIALMTASKAFNLLLLPACGLALLPSLPLLLRRPLASTACIFIAAAASMIPTALLNIKNCGDWTGMAAEPVRLIGGPPVFQVAVNALLILLANFTPPIFPFSGAWDRLLSANIPQTLSARLHQYFEADAARFRVLDMQAEESAGVGFGVSVLLLTIVIAQLFHRNRPTFQSIFSLRNLIALAALGGALIYMSQSGLYAPARYLLPLTLPIVLPILALPAAARLVRATWWRSLAICMAALAALLIIVAPARPLFPALTLLKNADTSSNAVIQRAATVYNVYRQRSDLVKPIREALPPDAKVVGVLLFNSLETSLWRPFGSRRVLHIRGKDSPQFTRSRGFRYIVVGPNIHFHEAKISPEEWARQHDGEIIGRFPIQILARAPAVDWLLIRLNP